MSDKTVKIIQEQIEEHLKAIEELNKVLDKLPPGGVTSGVAIARWKLPNREKIQNFDNKNKAL